MFIDKFYRIYNPYESQSSESRSSKLPTMNLKDDKWDGSDYKISNVKYGEDKSDVSTVGQILTRQGESFVQGDKKFEFLEVENDSFNGRKRKITNVAKGEELTDVPILGQTLTRHGDAFVQGSDKFEFIESENGTWNAKKRKITNVEKGENLNDAATMEQVLVRKDDGFIQGKDNFKFMESHDDNWEGKNQQLKNLKPGTDVHDAVIFSQVPTKTKGSAGGLEWDFKHFRLANAFFARNDDDCVIKKQTITLDDFTTPHSKFDAKNKQISNVKPGELPNDVPAMSQIVTYEDGVFKFGDLKFNLVPYNPKILVADPSVPFSGLRTLDGEPYIAKHGVYVRESDSLIVDGEDHLILTTNDRPKKSWIRDVSE